MSTRLNLGIGIGTLAVMLIMSTSNIYFTKIITDQIESLTKNINNINENAQKRGNISTSYFDELLNQSASSEKEILDNLLVHRHISNETRDEILDVLENGSKRS